MPIGSVIIPAHNEAAVIGRCLDSLLADARPGELDVVVVSNGSVDATIAEAAVFSPLVRVIDLPTASKVAAINAGESVSSALPRLYLDADVELPTRSARDVLAALRDDRLMAARPPIEYDTTGCSWFVKRYAAARTRLPSLSTHLSGAGIYGISERGRGMFDRFPAESYDDVFVQRLYLGTPTAIVDTDPVVVYLPRTMRSLLKVGTRKRRGNRMADGNAMLRVPTTRSTLRDLRALAASPRRWLDVLVFGMYAISVRALDRFGPRGALWHRDETSRAAGRA